MKMFKTSLQAIPKFSSFNHSGVDVIEEGHWAGTPCENQPYYPVALSLARLKYSIILFEHSRDGFL